MRKNARFYTSAETEGLAARLLFAHCRDKRLHPLGIVEKIVPIDEDLALSSLSLPEMNI